MPTQNNNRRSGLAGGGLAGQGAAPRGAGRPSQRRQQPQPQPRTQQRPPMQGGIPGENVPRQAPIPYDDAPLPVPPQYRQASQLQQMPAFQSAPMDKKTRKRMEKEQKKQRQQQAKASGRPKAQRQPKEAKAGLFSRIVFFFKTHSFMEIVQLICDWIDKNYLVPLLAAAIFIVIGLFFNRYISFGAAFVILLIGVYLSHKDLERGQYACYAAAMMAFIIPYLF